MTVHEQMEQYISMTNDMLQTILNDTEMSGVLRDSMGYSVLSGGKRLRPALCMATCELLGGDAEDALLPACAVEMIHAYSLIHDDLPALDNDELRRGKPSNHVAFGEANAIIAGDGLQSLAFRTAAGTENPRVLQALAAGAFDMVVGQSYDLTAGDDPERLVTIHRLKTGALIKAAMLAGAYCANPTQREILLLETYAEKYGLLFQITDDILDVEGDASLLGKSVGKDAEENKLTFVTRFGLEGAKLKAAQAAREALDALSEFQGREQFFRELVTMTLGRRN